MESQSILYGPEEALDEGSHLLHRRFEDFIENHPEVAQREALVFKNISVTFEQLNSRANKLARFLSNYLDNNIKKDGKEGNPSNIIGVFIPPSDDLIVLLFAILKLGLSYLPLDSTFPESRLSYILSDSRPLAVISAKENLARVSKTWNGLIINHENFLEEQIKSEQSDGNLESKEMIDENPSIVAVLYTSGSTGVPKGAALLYSAMLNRLRWQWTRFPFSENETCIFKTTLAFVDSIPEIFGALLRGKKLVIVSQEEKKNTQALMEILEKHEIERLMLVPSLLKSIFLFIRMSQQTLPKMRLIISSAEPVTMEFLQEFFTIFTKGTVFTNFYGSTEITDVTYSLFECPQDIHDKTIDNKVPIGIPIDNTNIYVLDGNRKVVPLGQIGEIYVSGKNVSKYLNQNSDSKYIPNEIDYKHGHDLLYHTGDFGRIFKNTLLYEGRNDSQIKIRGQRVDLSEIERTIVTVPGINACKVLCYHAGKYDQAVLAFYKTEDINLSESKLNGILSEKLPVHMMPLIFQVKDFPLLYNGKIDRQLLISQFESNAKSKFEGNVIDGILSEVDSTHRDAASTLFTVISQVLGLTRKNGISMESNFFEIGGNSLNVLQTISLLLNEGYSISIPDFLQSTSLRDVVNKMQLSSNSTIDKLSSVEMKYRTIPITDIPKAKILSIVSNSFITKGDLDQHTGASIEEFLEFVEHLWQSFMTSNASFGVVDVNNEVVGVSLNTNITEEPYFTLTTRMEAILDLLEYLEGPYHAELLEKGIKVMHGLLLGSADTLSAAENVQLVQFIEEENVQIAKANDYDAILTTNTSPLTQDICGKLLKYEVLKSLQANKYQDKNGFSAFASAPDSYCIQVAIKYLK